MPVVAVIAALGTDGELSLFAQWTLGRSIQVGDEVTVFFSAADGEPIRMWDDVFPWTGTQTYGWVINNFNPHDNSPDDWTLSNTGEAFDFWSFDEDGAQPASDVWYDIVMANLQYVPGVSGVPGNWILIFIAQWGCGADCCGEKCDECGLCICDDPDCPCRPCICPDPESVVVYFHPNRAGATLTTGASLPSSWTVTTVSGSERFVVPTSTNLGAVAGHVTADPAAPTFLGWSLLPNGAVMTAAELTAFLLNTSGTVHVFAQWYDTTGPVLVDVNFRGNGGDWDPETVQTVQNVAVGTLLSALLPANPVHPDGYNFLGWSLLQNGAVITNPATFPIMGPGPVEFYAQWNDGTTVPTITVTFTPNRTDATVNTLTVSTATLPAGWTASRNAVTGVWTFTLPEGTILGDVAAVINAQPADEFLGWSRLTVGAPLPLFYPLTEGMNLNAQWDEDGRTVPQVTIRFNATAGTFPTGTTLVPAVPPADEDDDQVVSMTVDAGTLLALVPVAQPIHSAETFYGWGAARVSAPLASTTIVTAGATYYAQWDAGETIAVTFNTNYIGATFPNGQMSITIEVPVTMTFGQALTAFATQLTITHADPTDSVFSGWTDFAGQGGNSMPLGDLVATSTVPVWFAQWNVPAEPFWVLTLHSNGSAYDATYWIIEVPRLLNGAPITYGEALDLAIAHFALPENGGYDLATLIHENEVYPFWGWSHREDVAYLELDRVMTWHGALTALWNDVERIPVAFSSADQILDPTQTNRTRWFYIRPGTSWDDVMNYVAPTGWVVSLCGTREFTTGSVWIHTPDTPTPHTNGLVMGEMSHYSLRLDWDAATPRTPTP